MFPNPAHDRVKVRSQKSETISATVYNLFGQKVLVSKPGTELSPDVSALASGTYMVEIVSDSGKAVRKLSKL